jgi:hypothetical protein
MENPNKIQEIAKAKPVLTEEELDEIIFPDISPETYTLADVVYRIRVLPWRWEKKFRKAVMPLIAQEVKPLEKIIHIFAMERQFIDEDLHLTESILDTEQGGDQFLTQAVVVICMSQDDQILAYVGKGQEIPANVEAKIETKYRLLIENTPDLLPSPRVFLREIVRSQMRKHEMVQRLGESCLARLLESATLVGEKQSFSSLKAAFSQRVRSYLELDGNAESILASSSIPPTASSAGTSSKNQKPMAHPPSVPAESDPTTDVPAAVLEKSTEVSEQAQTAG